MSDTPLRGQTAVITGAASGIGTGLARHAASQGMKLVLADVNAAQLEQFAATLTGAEVITVPTDVTDLAAVQRLADAAYTAYGQVDLLFNNAGVLATGFTWEIEPARFQRNMAVNVEGVLNGIRAFVPRLLAAARPAVVVNTASIGGFLPSPLMSPYSASKFAVVGLTESLHYELQMLQSPVRAALLCPGPVKSDIFGNPFGERPEPAAQQFVAHMRQMLEQHGISPEELAARAFAGINRGDYWLFPQPENIDGPLRERTETILSRAVPALQLG